MSERILIVDDELAIRRVLEISLRSKGYQTNTAGTGQEAWEEVESSGSENGYHLALVDIKLPDINGLDLVARIRKFSPQTEVILMTGYVSVETAVQAIRLGAFAYVTKPMQMEEFYQTVRQALEKQRLTVENRRLLAELKESNRSLEDLNTTLENRVKERTRELLESREEIQRRAQELSIINEITKAIASSLNLKEILGLVVRETRKLVDFDRASISLAWGSDEINEVYFLEPRVERSPASKHTYPIKGTGIEWVITNQRALIRSEFSSNDTFIEDDFIRKTGAKSGIVVPLIRRGEAIGTLNLGSMKVDAYNKSHEKILRQIAGQLAVAIDNASLYRRLEEHSKNLENEVAKRTASLKKSFRELETAQEKLIQSEKLAATAKLIAGVAHEIKNPLNSMSFSTANIETIFSTGFNADSNMAQPGELCRESISILRSDITRLKDLVDRFMSFARPVRAEREEININTIIQEVIRGLRIELEAKQIHLSEEYDDNLPPVKLEKDEFHRSILNLLLNALEAVKRGGRIEIRTGFGEGQIKVEVEDDGDGIPPEIRDKIFDVFFTTKDKGSGLGLSQVFRTVESHQGNIFFESRDGNGTIFHIEIPSERPI
jgi:signal transduction histidine kinase/DNA-binding response OmpR family regulator